MEVGAKVKEECSATPLLYTPQPIEGLHESGPPPFLTKTYDLVDDSSTDPVVSWTKGNNSFVVWDLHNFSFNLLPKYFKHNNFSSSIPMKVDPDRWEFANELFLRGQRQLLKRIRRRNNHSDACVEIERLRQEKQLLMAEIVKLRQEQNNTRTYLNKVETKIRGTEQKQQQMMSFLAKAIRSPQFMHKLSQDKDKRLELEETSSKHQEDDQDALLDEEDDLQGLLHRLVHFESNSPSL